MQPPLPSEPGGVSAVTREEQGIVGGRPPLQHEGDGEKQRSHNPLGRIKPTEGEFLLDLDVFSQSRLFIGKLFFFLREREHLYNVRTHLEKTQNSFLKAQTLKDVFYIRSRGRFTEKELVSRKKHFLESLEIFKRRYDV